jgi:hypothetical protein
MHRITLYRSTLPRDASGQVIFGTEDDCADDACATRIRYVGCPGGLLDTGWRHIDGSPSHYADERAERISDYGTEGR